MGTVSLNSCGTRMEDTGEYMVFKNEIDSVGEAGSVITRRNFVRIPFSCSYPKLAHVSTSFKNHKSDYVFTETGFGSFSYSFEFYTDSTYNSMIDPSSYPVDVKLLDMIYIGIQAHSTLPEVQLFVESCKATPDDDPNNPLYYDIIKNGCSMDETLVTFPSNSTKFNFELQAFKFTGDFEQVYISCRVILCEAGSPSSRCAEGCVQNEARRRKRQLFMETHGHFITQGPLRLERRSLRTSDEGLSNSQSSNVSTPVFAALFVISILLLFGVMAYNIKKSRLINHSHLLSSF
ncbi:ZP domain-containing protein-like [Megalops cyprinoides]|uniref:ZP domain-containing protein-like n=1 Tax=Megalops cyprinoides TaxID=118141 RepID=UPI001863F123|nr:ZP domain-containing protein-like [Megalops cyprinoides]